MSVTSCIWRSSHKILGVISHPCFWLFLKLSFHVIFLIFSEFSQAGVRDDQRHMETPTSSPGSSRFPIWRLLSLNSCGHHIGLSGRLGRLQWKWIQSADSKESSEPSLLSKSVRARGEGHSIRYTSPLTKDILLTLRNALFSTKASEKFIDEHLSPQKICLTSVIAL